MQITPTPDSKIAPFAKPGHHVATDVCSGFLDDRSLLAVEGQGLADQRCAPLHADALQSLYPSGGQEFRSPSGNILCLFCAPDQYNKSHALRCDIIEHRPSFNAPPADCDLDWQSLFFMEQCEKATQGCAVDVGATDRAPVLGCGEIVQQGGLVCRMEHEGLTCINREGHGFFISRAAQWLF